MIDRGTDVSDASSVTHDVALMSAALEHLPDIITICEAVRDEDGAVIDLRLLHMNTAARAAQPDAERAIGRLGTDLWPESISNGALAACFRVLETGVTESGSQRWDESSDFQVGGYDWLATALAPDLMMWVKHDDTERLRLIADLRRKEEIAIAASRAKSEFVSVMAHELRTPLNSILGFAQLLDLDDLTDTQVESVGFITRAGRHLLELVDDLLDIGRIESGQLSIDHDSPADADGGRRPEVETPPRRPVRVLCIEDNVANLTLVERALNHAPIPIEVVGVSTGAAGLDALRRETPDVVLLDLRLPDLTGEDLLRSIRANPATADLAVIILSADAHFGRIDALRALGANDYLTKPLVLRQLLDTVVRLAPDEAQRERRSSQPT